RSSRHPSLAINTGSLRSRGMPHSGQWTVFLIALGKVLALAAAYFISGRLGMLLAIPPGYATAMWPPAGFALAGILLLGYRYWPGVLLGSFAVNLFVSFDPSNTASIIRSGGIAAVIASSALMQALAGSWLIRRCVAFPIPLQSLRDIVLLLLLGGPLACLIAATIRASTMVVGGAVPVSEAVYNWLTWWVGDTIGVMVFAPILLLLANREVSRPRQIG